VADVIELRKSYGEELVEAVAMGVAELEAEGGRVTGYAFVVFGEDVKRRSDAIRTFRVEKLSEAAGEVAALHADIVDEVRRVHEDSCPECGA